MTFYPNLMYHVSINCDILVCIKDIELCSLEGISYKQ